MPLPAEFSGSLKRTSPSTTARWQSIGGDVRGGGGSYFLFRGITSMLIYHMKHLYVHHFIFPL